MIKICLIKILMGEDVLKFRWVDKHGDLYDKNGNVYDEHGNPLKPSARIGLVKHPYENKKKNTDFYELWKDGHFYGRGSLDYMTELFRDWVETCEMYGKDYAKFEVRKVKL